MNVKRFFKHLFITQSHSKKYFPQASLDKIKAVITESEKKHDAEIVFAIESSIQPIAAMQNYSARSRSIDVFSQLRVWDTEANNGVLVYLLLADHDIEIVADRGINKVAGEHFWEEVCKKMEENFRNGNFETGVIEGINMITDILAKYYPKNNKKSNEIPDSPVVM
ncbi:TPM domain-containing protein [Leptospira sp. GIMC2001]|uniref:TPM domain-containing protein n=1 Tax=Leptospira sp. GIMC2001 TaxID=1513297 RepID=UPI002349EC29|nr:TPM domain-containing protein [Leptospira sp. GIMC2001]WCL47643.1 TPM domain-containing protein [Leptospira sp. GIMC2001]